MRARNGRRRGRGGKDGRPLSFRRARTYEEGTDGDKVEDSNYYAEGYSDHFPVYTTLRRAPASSGGGGKDAK